MAYNYWFVRMTCDRCKQSFSCSVEQQYDRIECLACKSKP